MDHDLKRRLEALIEISLRGGQLPGSNASQPKVTSAVRDVFKAMAFRDLPPEVRMPSQPLSDDTYLAVIAFMGEHLELQDGLPRLKVSDEQNDFIEFLQANFWPYVLHFPNRARGRA